MNDNAQRTYRTSFWLLLACVTLLRLVFANSVGLGVDESHYFLYSRHLAWGYFDHPPMVAWLAWLTTLVQNSIFFIRLGPILCSAGSLVLLRYLALALYRDERVPFWATVMLLLMPYQHLLMVGLLPDATLNIFWCATLLAVWNGMKSGRWFAWILAGVSFGGALLSKYHAVLLPFCLFWYLILSPHRRFWLAKIQPYVAIFIGLLIFMPNILWNAQHQWISYSYQWGHGTGKDFSPGNILAYLGGQLGVWSPLIFVLLIVVYLFILRNKDAGEADHFALWTSMPVFLFFCVISAFGKILPHWPSVGWWTGSVAAAALTLRKRSRNGRSAIRWRRWWTAAAILGLIMTAVLYVGAFYPIVGPLYTTLRNASLKLHHRIPAIKPLEPFKSSYDITNELYGWKQIAAEVETLRTKMPHPAKTFVFAHRFYTTSQLGVYLQPDTVATSLYRKYSQYRIWYPAENYLGWDALFVDDDRFAKDPRRYLPLFDRLDSDPERLKVYRNGHYLVRDIKIYRYYGFKGRYEK